MLEANRGRPLRSGLANPLLLPESLTGFVQECSLLIPEVHSLGGAFASPDQVSIILCLFGRFPIPFPSPPQVENVRKPGRILH